MQKRAYVKTTVKSTLYVLLYLPTMKFLLRKCRCEPKPIIRTQWYTLLTTSVHKKLKTERWTWVKLEQVNSTFTWEKHIPLGYPAMEVALWSSPIWWWVFKALFWNWKLRSWKRWFIRRICTYVYAFTHNIWLLKSCFVQMAIFSGGKLCVFIILNISGNLFIKLGIKTYNFCDIKMKVKFMFYFSRCLIFGKRRFLFGQARSCQYTYSLFIIVAISGFKQIEILYP